MILADSSAWLAVFGRAHVLFLHAPLVLVPAVALLEFGAALLRRPAPRGAVLALACFAALAGALAATSGLVLGGDGDYDADLLSWHQLSGIALGATCVGIGIASGLQRRAPLRVLLVVGIALLVPAGHYGGSMTHGQGFLLAPLKPHAGKPEPTPANGATAPTASEFERTVQPILERACTGCHNNEKKKGELLLTTREGITKGGENGAVIVPGKPDESPLVVRCELPADDDDHMPPKGKKQPTRDEVAALRAWVAAGAR